MSTRWTAALREHETEVHALLAVLRDVPVSQWTAPRADGGWTVAQEAQHLAITYEYGIDAAAGTATMRQLTPRALAWVSRTVLLPLFLATRTFPRGARAPAEVRPPDEGHAPVHVTALLARLQSAASGAAEALQVSARAHPERRVVHAYFGPLRPRLALRLLSAHTRHHRRSLARRVGSAHG